MEERERDEYGMEEVDGLFSSPEKSPANLNGFSPADDDTASSEMSIEDGMLPYRVCAPTCYQLMTDIFNLLRDQAMRRDLWIFSALRITRAVLFYPQHLDPLQNSLDDPLSCDPHQTIEKTSYPPAHRMADDCLLREATQPP